MHLGPKDCLPRSFSASTGGSERYHKLFDEVFTMQMCCPSHMRVNARIRSLQRAICLLLAIVGGNRHRAVPALCQSGTVNGGQLRSHR